MQKQTSHPALRKIAIVMPVYNRRDTTLQGLRSLARIDRSGLEVHVVVVDDASPDGTAAAIAEQFPDVHLVLGDGDLHYAAGTNRGIETALQFDPEFILTANDDAVFHHQFLKRMIETADKDPRSIVGALLLLWDQPHKVFQVGQRWETLKGGWVMPEDLTAFNVPQSAFGVECIVGNCVLFPVAAIRENGLMDERRFPHGWGDAQYLMRMRKAGWRLMIEPKAFVWCEPNTYPAPLHSLGLRRTIEVLFKDEKHPLNLRRQFIARWESAPSRVKAMAAYFCYLFLIFKKAVEYSINRPSPNGLNRHRTESPSGI